MSNRFPHPFITLVLLLPLILFWRWLLKGEVLFWGTILFQFWPWRHLAKTIALSGQWPLWNPLSGNGTPLLANLQTAFLYPPNLLLLFLPVEHGLTLSVVLHLILAGLGMYVYARHLELSPFAATLSALAYMLSGYLTGRTQFVTMINALAWIPLLLFLSDRLATGQRGRDVLWMGLALAGQILAGHAQLWFYTLWLIGPYTLFRSWQTVRLKTHLLSRPAAQSEPVPSTRPEAWRTIAGSGFRLGLAFVLALLLAAGQLLPTAEFTLLSPRNHGAERTFALTYSFWPWRLVTLLIPDLFGNPADGDYWGYANYWEDHAYQGVLPLLLALFAIGHYFRSRPGQSRPSFITGLSTPSDSGWPPDHFALVTPFFVWLIPLSLLLAMGWNTPVYLWVFEYIPGFAYFQAPARLLIWYTVAVAVLAGIGAQLFQQSSLNRRRWQRLLVACLGIILAAGLARFFLTGRSRTFLDATLSFGLLTTLAIILLLLYPNRPATRPKKPRPNWRLSAQKIWWQWVVLIFISADLLLAAMPLIPTMSPVIFHQPVASAAVLQNRPGHYRYFVDRQFDYTTKFEQFFRFETFGPLQPEHWQRFKESLVPNTGIYAGLPTANNDDPLVAGHWRRFIDLLPTVEATGQSRLLALMNVAYLITSTGPDTWPAIYQNGTMVIRQVPEVLPRAYFVAQAYHARNEAQARARLLAADFDPGRQVIIMKPAGWAGDFVTRPAEAKPVSASTTAAENSLVPATVVDQGPNQVVLFVEAPTDGFVVLADTFYPGWQATVDSRPVPIYMANMAFRAVPVTAGPHQIVFSYRPASFTVGLWLSLVTLLAVIVGLKIS
uniref:Hypothetical conserved protein n=1 Tax=uncultured Chloroflexota bacterium TaxID=166587 RepID=H5SN32_9CHLR|nr:hypothetical conserved protein [uncultured Chloroflexota bacterium]